MILWVLIVFRRVAVRQTIANAILPVCTPNVLSCWSRAGNMWQVERCHISRSPLGWSCAREMQEKMHCRLVQFPYSWVSLCLGLCAGETHKTSERYGWHVGFWPLSPSVLPCPLFLEHWLMLVSGGDLLVRHMLCKSRVPCESS